MLADLDEVPVGITHVAAQFPTAIIQGFGEQVRGVFAPLFVASPDIGNAQIEEAVHSVETRRCFERTSGFSGLRPASVLV